MISGDAKEMMDSMEILGPDGRLVFRGGYLTSSGEPEKYEPGKGPWPMWPMQSTSLKDHSQTWDVSDTGEEYIATGELYSPEMQMPLYPIPSLAAQYDYLLLLYFGNSSDPMTSCIRRAYRDLSRTIHGLGKVKKEQADKLWVIGSDVIRSFLNALKSPEATASQDAFDRLHHSKCDELCRNYATDGSVPFTVGQAQKWLNMALKYVFVFGEERMPGYARVFSLAHAPLDNIILKKLRSYPAISKLKCAWSRVGLYDDYMKVQHGMRAAFPGSAPLAVEHALYLEQP